MIESSYQIDKLGFQTKLSNKRQKQMYEQKLKMNNNKFLASISNLINSQTSNLSLDNTQHFIKLFIRYHHFVTHCFKVMSLESHQLLFSYLLFQSLIHQKLHQTVDLQVFVNLVRYQKTCCK